MSQKVSDEIQWLLVYVSLNVSLAVLGIDVATQYYVSIFNATRSVALVGYT